MYQLATRSELHSRLRKRHRKQLFSFFVAVVLTSLWWVLLAPTAIGGPITYAVVSGQSMEPQYLDGDLVVAKSQETYEIGDSIVYEIYGGYVIHQVIAKDGIEYLTQGVNNAYADSWIVYEDTILGKELLSVQGLGNNLVFLRTHPLALGFLVTALAALLLIEIKPHSISKRLKKLLLDSKREPPTKTWRVGIWLSATLFMLTVASLVATSIMLTRGVDFYPRVAITLAAAVLAAIAFEVVGAWLNAGEALVEPYRSIRVFSHRLFLLDSKIDIPGQSELVDSAKHLRHLAEVANSPIIHITRKGGKLHEFWLITDDLNYFWRVST